MTTEVSMTAVLLDERDQLLAEHLAEAQPVFDDAIQGECVLLLSGGLVSTVILFEAISQYKGVHAITVNYGQRMLREFQAATRIASLAKCKTHKILPLNDLFEHVGPMFVSSMKVPQFDSMRMAIAIGDEDEMAVPMRTEALTAIGKNRCFHVGGVDVLLGAKFISGKMMVEMVCKAASLPGCFAALAFSHTCYENKYPPAPHNLASIRRALAFRDAGFADPLIMRAKREGLLPADYPDHGYVASTKYQLKGAP